MGCLYRRFHICVEQQLLSRDRRRHFNGSCTRFCNREVNYKTSLRESCTANFNQVQVVGNEIRILGDVSKERIAKWMFDEGILLTTVMKYEKSLEEYYMELLGRK